MLADYIRAGEKVEMESLEVNEEQENANTRALYVTKVYDILSEDRLEVFMPMEKSKLILLPVDSEYNVYFYTARGLYQGFVRIVDRYKAQNVYLLALELTSNLKKYQRREYFRLNCALEIETRELVDEEKQDLEFDDFRPVPGMPLNRGVAVDISGGGMRFISGQKYEGNSMIYITYRLMMHGRLKKYDLAGRVLGVKESEKRPGNFEHHVKYVNMDESVREEIIKYIFEEERRHRHKKAYGSK